MDNQKITIYQRLSRLMGGGSTQSQDSSYNTYNIQNNTFGNDVIDVASSPEERDFKILQTKQQKLLANQWYKAQKDINNKYLGALSGVRLLYHEADLFDSFCPEASTAMDLIAEEVCHIGKTGSIVNISSSSNRVKAVLEDLFTNRLALNTTLPMITRGILKYGNNFRLLNIDQNMGVLGWKELPVQEIERYENGMDYPYTSSSSTQDKDETKFVWVGQTQSTQYRNWQIAHFRLLYDSSLLPYGVSILHKARRHFRMLSYMEDMLLLYRLDRSVERRVFKINVGAIDEADVPAYIHQIANDFKRTEIVDPMTGQIDLRKNIMSQSNDFFIPVREDGAPSPIETLPATQNLTAMDDIKYIQNKIFTALRVPKAFLNFEDAGGDGKNLSLLDVRFMRTVNRIQQAILLELNKIATIHLLILGFTDDLTNFSLTMNNPSSQAEMLEVENLAKKITTAKDAVNENGNGMPLFSMVWVWRNIFKLSDKEIKENLEQLRLERALSTELQKTSQIIKRTNIFDPVDNIYGEPGAQYSFNPEETSNGNDSGSDFSMSDMDFGDDFQMGMEGDMDMDSASAEDMEINQADGDNEANTNGQEKLAETKTKNRKINLLDLYMETIKNKDSEPEKETPKIYDTAFLINEEINTMAKELNSKVKSELTD